MRMSREDTDSYGEIGVLHCGKRFRYNKKEIVAGKGEKHREFEESDHCTKLQITPYRERKRKERDPQYHPTEEGIPSQIRICVEPMTPCASLRIEAGTETCSREIVISGGSQRNSQNSGSSTTNQSQLTSPRVSTTPNTMAGVDHTLRMLEFQGTGSEDPEQHLFVCDTIWTVKNVQDEVTKIVQLAMTFRGHALLWYMKFQTTTPSRIVKKFGRDQTSIVKRIQEVEI
jgi:hypothetical protein